LLKWAGAAGRLTKLHEGALEAAVKSITRWSAKWQQALRTEVAELPEPIAAVLRAPAAPAEAPPGEESAATDEPREQREDAPEAEHGETGEATPADEQPELPRRERPVYEPRPQRPQPLTEPARGRDPQREQREPREQRDRKERPVYQPRSGSAQADAFNLPDVLRQIEAHVQTLRSELSAAQSKLRQREEDPRRGRRGQERPSPIMEGEPTNEELARLNQQLEARNTELQARIDDLLADSEDRAVSTGAMAGEAVEDTGHQLRTLLALKLQEDYEDFLALEEEAPDFVVQQHYKALLKDVFKVLLGEGVAFKERAQD
jgi:hypothetical protein